MTNENSDDLPPLSESKYDLQMYEAGDDEVDADGECESRREALREEEGPSNPGERDMPSAAAVDSHRADSERRAQRAKKNKWEKKLELADGEELARYATHEDRDVRAWVQAEMSERGNEPTKPRLPSVEEMRNEVRRRSRRRREIREASLPGSIFQRMVDRLTGWSTQRKQAYLDEARKDRQSLADRVANFFGI